MRVAGFGQYQKKIRSTLLGKLKSKVWMIGKKVRALSYKQHLFKTMNVQKLTCAMANGNFAKFRKAKSRKWIQKNSFKCF